MKIWSPMGHPTDAEWRAYLDGEVCQGRHEVLDRHLRQCIRCRAHLAAIQETANFAAARLGALHAVAEIAPVPPMPGRPHPVAASKPAPKEGVPMTRFRFTSRIAAGTAAAVLLASLFVPSVRAAAADFVAVFRVKEAKVIRINPAELGNMSGTGPLAGVDPAMLEQLLQFETAETGEQRHNLTGSELKALGYKAPAWLPEGYTPTTGSYLGENRFSVRPDVDRVNDVLELLGSKERLPATLKGQTLTVASGPNLIMGYRTAQGANLTVMQGRAPAFSATGNVDVSRVLSVVTSVIGEQAQLPESIRSQFRGLDLTKTLPLPVVEGESQEVSVSGKPGVYQQWDTGGGLIWVDDGIVRAVASMDHPLPIADLLRIAESLER